LTAACTISGRGADKLNNIGEALFRRLHFPPFQNPDGEHMVQQEEQQQQSAENPNL
jgi:hypothetical protein